jgi:segregation and condensation protein A
MPSITGSNASHLRVKTSVYEGPLEMLLELIEKRKLLINDIALASVTDEYIAKVSGMQELPVGETANFVALAATLLLIKSRSLLPSLALSDEESQDIKQLEYRLALYQIIRDAAHGLPDALRTPYLYEVSAPEPEPLFLPDMSVTAQSLRTAAQTLMEGFPQLTHMPQVQVRKIISLEEMIQNMATRVSSAFRTTFREFTKSSKGADEQEVRHHVIVSFLALLELVKQGILKATQEGEDISMESDSVSTPSYEL